MATMTEIARLAGVSRGTVDRVINDRGGVSPGVREHVLRVAAQLGYSPNKTAQSLSARKRETLIEFIMLSPEHASCCSDMRRGAESAAVTLRESGASVKLRFANAWNADDFLVELDSACSEGAAGIAISCPNDPRTEARLRQMIDAGLPIVTVDSDIADIGQTGMVGCNDGAVGRTAAGLFKLARRKAIRLGVIYGRRNPQSRAARIDFIKTELDKHGNDSSIQFCECDNDDEFDSFDIAKTFLQTHPSVNALLLMTDGAFGACRAIERLALSDPPAVVCCGTSPSIRGMIEKRVITAALDCQHELLGELALKMLFEHIALGILPAERNIITDTQILIAENI